ncbi:Metallo-peptidase family M12-domain-containing protein [Naematelia encephala]|uniref:Disintegrin and metalloproteinase domain-containing protein B n=1 Tax=Naematelia encephala TaxID=71784 RepID=A0A1Y2AUS2_9TREE|nr:Metallo-peptidase family M12-domain-containing protein [Naematelia encephala]
MIHARPRIMWWPHCLLAVLVLLVLVEARSPRPPPIKRIHHPSRSTLSIFPRHAQDITPRSLNPSPPPSSLRHDDTLLISLTLPDLDAYFLLRPTENLFHPEARVKYHDRVEKLNREDWRLYTGEVIRPNWVERVKWAESHGLREPQASLGEARIMVHRADEDVVVFEGSFEIDGVTHHVLTKEHYERVRQGDDVEILVDSTMVVFRDTDREPLEQSCSHDHHPFNSNLSHPVWQNRFSDTGFVKRDDYGGGTVSSNYINSINQTAGCPNEQQIVYMGVALDCNYVQEYGSTSEARNQTLNNWNQVSALYRSTFNISLGIIELVVEDGDCSRASNVSWNVPCSANITLDERLSDFSQWRGDRGDDGAGLWHLLSACPTDQEVGVAWLGTLCETSASQQTGSTVSGTAVSTYSATEWSLIAHEIGHNFGAIHDCTTGCTLSGTCCPFSTTTCSAGGGFIMNPTTSNRETTFSGCSLGNVCSNIGSQAITTSCIQTPGSQTILSLQQCGNGVVEDGEECDPGGTNSTCCDAQTCKFVSGAVCDPTNSACCTSTCQYSASGTVCRAAVDSQCDYAETCTGTNATCPADRHANDGQSCGSSGLACASGRCTSLSAQCQASGTSLNLTTACGQRNDKSCAVSCRDPTTANQCVVLQTPLIDGSPCGYGGHCYNETCQSGSWQSTAAAWYRQNLQISIPVTVVVGIIVLAISIWIIRCIYRSCTRRNKPTLTAPPMRQSTIYPPPPVTRHSGSVSSQDAMTSTAVIRDSSPAPHAPVTGYYDQNGRRSGYASGVYPGQSGYASGTQSGYAGGVYPGQSGYANGAHPGQTGYAGGSPSHPDQQGWAGPTETTGYSSSPQNASLQGWAGHAQNNGHGASQARWVDENMYNGPDYGYREAYGR